jgi:hypothetical protein
MKSKILMAFSYFILSAFIAFLISLVKPLFPTISLHLDLFAVNMNKLLNLNLNPKFISLAIAFLLFVILYFVLSKLTGSVRRKYSPIQHSANSAEMPVRKKNTIIKILFILILIPLIFAYFQSLLSILRLFTFSNPWILSFSIGFIIYSILWFIVLKKNYFFSTFEHEFTHMILGMCFFHSPKAIIVDKEKGGLIALSGSNFIVTLGPYFFLTLCFFWIPFYYIIKPNLYFPYFLILGSITSYHTWSTFRETQFNIQPDIINNGKIFSFFVILLGNIINYGIILSFILGGFFKIREFLFSGILNIINYVKFII